ncbi:PP2C family serine/threonine-protein phosphatase [Aquibacillus rhizosphaerae]|uniref:Indirect negative regulator of sigma-B activity n=1 Tax=Aquibacillus rhizosphaerae TaxID=3051431 RepID=A0ABT7KZS3_9BACI|nr:indirect negative regulator of sigma-B activity [Aquibacillus sp. LR5S19]MDL4839052.1 indirect negative regulator of sigma-B activity [Aquibacillus sp. LR5S19]
MLNNKRMDVSVYQKPKKGNYYCGDSYFFRETENDFICALADGLGSGEYAKESSQAVIEIIEDNIHSTVEHIIKQCNKSLIGKRGVVLGVLKINFASEYYTFSSIGNIGVMTLFSKNEKKRNIPNAGYLGGYPRPVKVSREKLVQDMVFIMFSDGVNPKDLSKNYFFGKDVEKITETFSSYIGPNENDDTTLIAMKYS